MVNHNNEFKWSIENTRKVDSFLKVEQENEKQSKKKIMNKRVKLK
jgi:hypothetical protein